MCEYKIMIDKSRVVPIEDVNHKENEDSINKYTSSPRNLGDEKENIKR